jgi:ATP-binding cassette subfamily F protein uup
LDGQGHADFYADLSQWEETRARERAKNKGKAVPVEPPKPVVPESPKPVLSSKELKELKEMESVVPAAEERLKAAKAKLEDPAIARDFGKLQEYQKQVEAEQAKLDALFKRWEELEAKMGRVK